MDTTILPLAEAAGLRSGETIDVLLGDGDAPMYRTLRNVRVKREWGKDWLLLEWDAHGMTPWGTGDCGFAGWVVDDELRARIISLCPNG